MYKKEQRILLELLRELRLNAKKKQSELAIEAKFNQSIISKYELGERRLDIIELRRICKALNITLVNFVKELEKRINS